jgi:hypothetical protein
MKQQKSSGGIRRLSPYWTVAAVTTSEMSGEARNR